MVIPVRLLPITKPIVSAGGSGQLGNNLTQIRTTPTLVDQTNVTSDAYFTQITAGWYHTCAIATDDKAYCWGQGSYGRLGNGLTTNQLRPVAVSQGAIPTTPTAVTLTEITAGAEFTCSIGSDGKAYC